MRILLAQNALYFPSRGGGEKSNRLLMEALAARSHAVRVVSRTPDFGVEPYESLIAELRRRDVHVHSDAASPAVRFVHHGVDVHVLAKTPRLRSSLSHQVASFAPDIILVSTDDPAQLLLDIALRAAAARVVYLVRAIVATPFGPDSASPSAAKTAVLQQVDGAVGVSEYVAAYARRHGGLPAVHVPISMLEPEQPACLGRFDNPFVSMVNPCGAKGISIFLGLARRMPGVQFAAVPSWATTQADMGAMRELPNVAILEPYDHPDELLRRTRVMLVPSLWAEARSRLILESMIRGIPVLASDAGGSREAALGAGIILPVNPVVRYKSTRDQLMVPQAEIPAQNLEPWHAALERLISEPEFYAHASAQVRAAALGYARTLTAEPLEKYLEQVLRTPKRATPVLSAGKQLLLARRIRQQRGQQAARQEETS